MAINNQQFNYPLSPDFIPEKQPGKIGQWLKNMTPKKRGLLLSVMGAVLIIVVAAVYLIFAQSSGETPVLGPGEVSSGNVLYLQSDSTGTIVEVGDVRTFSINLKVDKDVVALAAQIKYDSEKFRISLSDAPAFPIKAPEDSNDTANGIYTLIRGTYGDGNVNNGTATPQTQRQGFRDNSTAGTAVAFLRVEALAEADASEIKIVGDSVGGDNQPKIVLDDGSGTLEGIAGHNYNLKIIPAIPISEKLKLMILNNVFQCVKKTDGFYLTAQWSTNKDADSALALVENGQPGSATTDDVLTKNHSITIGPVLSQGEYKITSKEGVGETPQTDSVTEDYDCEETISDLKIKDLMAKITSDSAEVTFMTAGGTNEGKAIGSVSGLNLGSQAGASVGCNGQGACNLTDASATNVHKFNLNGLTAETTYVVSVKAVSSGSSDAIARLVFTTKPEKEKDVTKTTNIVLKVERDRECNSWLYCKSSVQVKNSKGATENLCFDVGLCDQLDNKGNCISSVDLGELGVSGANQTFEAPQLAAAGVGVNSSNVTQNKTLKEEAGAKAEENIKNLSGLSKVGLDWGENKIIEGLKHIAAMTTVGKNINIPNGNFELGDIWPWQANDVAKISITGDIYNTGNKANSILQVAADTALIHQNSDNYSGAKIPLGNVSGGSNYILSFTARANVGSEEIKKLRLQVRNGSKYSDVINTNNGLLDLGQSTKNFVVPIDRALTKGYSELIFNQQTGDWNNATEEEKTEFLKEFYIDNVSMQPVLHIQNAVADNDNKFVARTCRLYPGSSAANCNSISSSGKIYRGWKGFCLEPDPANENLCLNWYPVDIIDGETDVFAADSQAGYTDRKPLYYCLEAPENFSKKDVPDLKVVADPGGGGSGFADGVKPRYVGQASNYRITYSKSEKADGKKHKLFVAFAEKDFQGADFPYVYENAYEFLGKKLSRSEINGIFLSDGTDYFNMFGNLLVAEDVTSQTGVTGENYKHCYWSANNVWRCDLMENKGPDDFNIWGVTGSCDDDGISAPGNFFGIELIFDGQNSLEKIRMRTCDDDDGRTDDANLMLTFILSEPCNVLAEVVDPFGKNYAFSSKIQKPVGNNTTGNWLGSDNILGYKYDQDYAPYGAAVPPAKDTNYPEFWTAPLYVMPPDTSFGTAPYQVRAGSPYSINTGLDQTVNDKAVCVMGSFEGLGSDCKTNYDCGVGLNGESGLCMGINLTADQQTKIGGGYKRGVERLSQLFAKGLAAWVWSSVGGPTNNGGYLQVCSINKTIVCDQSDPDLQVLCNNFKNLCWDNTKVSGTAPTVSNIKVNGMTSGNVNLYGSAGAELRFNSSLNQDQLPLVAYRVDWGDGTNNSPSTSEVTNLNIAPKTDINNPHIMLHTYTCNDENSAGWNLMKEYCEFTPKIQVEDNWGWCNGGNETDLCPTNTDSWTPFAGVIIVRPK